MGLIWPQDGYCNGSDERTDRPRETCIYVTSDVQRPQLTAVDIVVTVSVSELVCHLRRQGSANIVNSQ